MKTLLLSRDVVRTALTVEASVAAVEAALLAKAHGEAGSPPAQQLALTAHAGSLRAAPGYVDGVACFTLASSYPQNPGRGLPVSQSLCVLVDAETGASLAIIDGSLIAALRAGASAAVASKHLARPPRNIGFIGCGALAPFLCEAHRVVFGAFEIVAADASPEAAARFAAESRGHVGTLEQAAGCDIVCTATPSRSPVLLAPWLAEGAHVNAVGADSPGKQELDPKILVGAKVVVDDLDQAIDAGEVGAAVRAGVFREERVYATLGEVVAGKKKGREGSETSVFDATGLAIEDAALARIVYRTALEHGLGQSFEFFPG